jgi:hypothetical protein
MGFLGLNPDQWLTISGVVVGIVGAVFGILQWRLARFARTDAKEANQAQRDMVTEMAELRTQLREQHEATQRAEHERDQTGKRLKTVEARTDVYRDASLWMLFGMELRDWERRQRAYLMPDRISEDFTEPMPEPPFDDAEVLRMGWDADRVSSEHVRAAFQVSFDTSAAWFNAHQKFAKEVLAAVAAERTDDDPELARLASKLDEAANEAEMAARALLDVMAHEVALSD